MATQLWNLCNCTLFIQQNAAFLCHPDVDSVLIFQNYSKVLFFVDKTSISNRIVISKIFLSFEISWFGRNRLWAELCLASSLLPKFFDIFLCSYLYIYKYRKEETQIMAFWSDSEVHLEVQKTREGSIIAALPLIKAKEAKKTRKIQLRNILGNTALWFQWKVTKRQTPHHNHLDFAFNFIVFNL